MSIRRLPVYIAIDCSESMVGTSFDAVRRGLDLLINELRGNPQALETAWLSLITFGRNALRALPLTDISIFQMPKLVLGSGTALGAALLLIEKQLKSEVKCQTQDQKGDWKPIVFILTDGEPTDAWRENAARFKAEISGKKANVIAVGCGNDVNISTLKEITDNVIFINAESEASFSAFFKWVSASVQATSIKYSSGKPEAFGLPELPPNIEMGTDVRRGHSDLRVFLQSKCSRTKQFYLIRYNQAVEKKGLFGNKRLKYVYSKSYPLEDFDYETASADKLTVSTDQLDGIAICPYCSNQGWGMCVCGHILCMNLDGGKYTCPWCNKTDTYALSVFDVGRGAG